MGPTSVLQSDRALNLFTRLIFTKIQYQTHNQTTRNSSQFCKLKKKKNSKPNFGSNFFFFFGKKSKLTKTRKKKSQEGGVKRRRTWEVEVARRVKAEPSARWEQRSSNGRHRFRWRLRIGRPLHVSAAQTPDVTMSKILCRR